MLTVIPLQGMPLLTSSNNDMSSSFIILVKAKQGYSKGSNIIKTPRAYELTYSTIIVDYILQH